ncbi:hypothetical protein IW147_005068 [Coemansia sp. RSA 720]|nr:hypothetical protein IW147_005068 [Coemansia sp. RSA 720]
MSDLETNVIALPVPGRSISWRRYEFNSSTSSGLDYSVVLSACHQLLDARVPCLWRPVGSSDEAGHMLDAIAKGESLPSSIATDAWEIWVFHGLSPERSVSSLKIIPQEFKSVESGEILWNSVMSETSSAVDSNTDSSTETHNIFYRSLDNLVDRALMSLSIVRFGFRQWITLDKASVSIESTQTDDESLLNDWQLPPTPSSPSTCLQLDASDFIAESAQLEHAQYKARPATKELSQGKSVTEASHPFILQFTANAAPQALLLQHNAQKAAFLRPMSQLESILNRHSNALPAAQITEAPTATPIACAKVAPYGVAVHILSAPGAHLGAMEDKAIDAWTQSFGYSKELLASVATQGHGEPALSNLVWISMTDSDEPMLYPQRLVFINEKETAALYAAKSTAANAAVGIECSKTDTEPEAAPKPSIDDVRMEPEDEREEGEDEEGEYDEEGEIADPPAPAEQEIPLATTELDVAVAQLGAQSPLLLEKSLIAIQESIAQFQTELAAEEKEEARKRKLQAKDVPKKQAKAVTGDTKVASSKTGTTNGTRKRQRSIARDEKPAKSRRKSDARDTRSESSNDDIPLQALVECSAPPLPVAMVGSTDAGIDGLFGDVQTDGPETDAQGDMELGFGEMGDDMGLGMDMGMSDSLGAGMGDFGGSMFGVTDDDFNFFDSVPAQHVKIEAPASVSQPGMDADAMDIDMKHDVMFSDAAGSQSADALVSADANQSMDDLFDDDNMFDSFFGGPATSADTGVPLASADAGAPFLEPSNSHSMSEAPIASLVAHTEAPTIMQTLSSPPGIASVLSATETHVGSSVEPPPSTMDVDLATPASIKMTPAPSTDILTPTSSAHTTSLPKVSLVEDHSVDTSIAPRSLPSDVLDIPTPSLAAPTSRKPSTTAVKFKNPELTPKPYSSISTPFDDIGSNSRSWLRDRPTPARTSDSCDLDALDTVQHASLVEKSLNPVSWIRRISARKLQNHAQGSSTARIPQSIRRLRGWLSTYKAKLSYTRDFVPPSVRSAQAAIREAQEDAAADACGTEASEPMSVVLDVQRGADATADLQYPAATHAKERDGHLPTFMSIINPRAAVQATGAYVQMPGALPVSLDIGSLHMAAASVMSPPAQSPACMDSALVVSMQAVVPHWVPEWMRVCGSVAELLVSAPPRENTVWSTVYGGLVRSMRGSLQTAGSQVTYTADISLARPAPHVISSVQPLAAGNLGARIGGLLKLGSGSVSQEPVTSEPHLLAAETPAKNKWISELRTNESSWTGIVEMLSDWAVFSTMLECVQHGTGNELPPDSAEIPWTPVTSALLSFWGNGSDDDESSGAESGQLSLSKLVSFESATPSATSKYRGYVVKKRRSAHAAANNISNNVAETSSGLVPVPSGPGTIEPLLDMRVLVGTYGQQDVHVDAEAGPMRRRDAEAMYVKRWRYTQKLATRATHEARVAAGEIEEAEEGEEREDGENADDRTETEDWPDPDCFTMESEDALRRVCIATAPSALRWWPQLHMRPVGASKDVRWVAFVPPPMPCTDGMQDVDDRSEDGSVAHTPCARSQRTSTLIGQYLSDVDSAYQASHLGTHRPLVLPTARDGVFRPQPSSANMSWTAHVRLEAQRLGHAMAHAWYAASQLEPSSDDSTAPSSTVIVYMAILHPHALEPWLALAHAACTATHTFASTLSSLSARTARGVPSSTTVVRSHIVWPALVVHPLPVQHMPCAQHTALSVYNRCPEFLAHTPSASMLSGARSDWPASGREFLAHLRAPDVSHDELVRHSSYFVPGTQSVASAFAHRAFIVSMPAVFPLAACAVVAAAMPVSAARIRTDTAIDTGSPGLNSTRIDPVTEPAGSTGATEPIEPIELPEVLVQIRRDTPLHARLTDHPLQTNDSTLHCVYSITDVGSHSWLAVCYCDERGEYTEHDVFVCSSSASYVSPQDAARVWRGCMRYMRMFGSGLRIVLAQWHGMVPATARQWRSYFDAYAACCSHPPILLCASIAVNSPHGLRLRSLVPRVNGPSQQWSLVLHGRQPHIASASSGISVDPEESVDLRRWPTGYLVLQDRRRSCTPLVACLCVQLLDHAADACALPHLPDLPNTRAVLRQYHQLACLHRAESDAAEYPPHADASSLHLLPLPVAIVANICHALELLT